LITGDNGILLFLNLDLGKHNHEANVLIWAALELDPELLSERDNTFVEQALSEG